MVCLYVVVGDAAVGVSVGVCAGAYASVDTRKQHIEKTQTTTKKQKTMTNNTNKRIQKRLHLCAKLLQGPLTLERQDTDGVVHT